MNDNNNKTEKPSTPDPPSIRGLDWIMVVSLAIYAVSVIYSLILTVQVLAASISCIGFTGAAIWFHRKGNRFELTMIKSFVVGTIIMVLFLFIRYDLNNKLVVYDFNENKFINRSHVALVMPSQSVIKIERIDDTPDGAGPNTIFFEWGNFTWRINYSMKVNFNAPDQVQKHVVSTLENKSWLIFRRSSFGGREIRSRLWGLADVHSHSYVELINTLPTTHLRENLGNLLAKGLTQSLKEDGIDATVEIRVTSITGSAYFN